MYARAPVGGIARSRNKRKVVFDQESTVRDDQLKPDQNVSQHIFMPKVLCRDSPDVFARYVRPRCVCAVCVPCVCAVCVLLILEKYLPTHVLGAFLEEVIAPIPTQDLCYGAKEGVQQQAPLLGVTSYR